MGGIPLNRLKDMVLLLKDLLSCRACMQDEE